MLQVLSFEGCQTFAPVRGNTFWAPYILMARICATNLRQDADLAQQHPPGKPAVGIGIDIGIGIGFRKT